MFPTLFPSLLSLILSTTGFQAAFSQPVAAQAPMLVKNDIRQVVRRADDNEGGPPPPGMVFVPGGSVTIGTDPSKIEDLGQRDFTSMTQIAAEVPQHSATVAPFYIDQTEVTNLQWKAFLDATGRKPSADLVKWGWPDGKIPQGQEDLPVGNVSFTDVRDFLVWCGKRLPTEEEWVRAARGDDARTYPWGDKFDPKFCRGSSATSQMPVAVGSFPQGASPCGALDMLGNVWEWVDSPFAAYPSYSAPSFKQGRQTVTLAPGFNSLSKVIRGGGFDATRLQLRIDFRFGMNPTSTDAALGFRAARSKLNGLDAIRNGLRRLVPPQFATRKLDETDIFAEEHDTFDDSHKLLTGYRYLAFGHRASERGSSSLSSIKKSAREEQLPLGILVTSEPMAMLDMKGPKGQAVVLPPGEYTLTYKGEGESKEYKEEQKQKRAEAKDRKKDKTEEPAPEADPSGTDGAAAPWPGVNSAHDIAESVDFPQDDDVILFWNANNVVVGWQKAVGMTEEELSGCAGKSEDGGKTWNISFSLDQMTSGKKNPRFQLPIHLAGEGLPPVSR